MLEFNIPGITRETNETEGHFVIEPLERGYGTTLGNSLRRVMLSSLPGAAVQYVRIGGAVHEFSVLNGVKEDVCEIILNIKGIVAKIEGQASGTGYIDAVGPCVVTAGDIRCDSSIEIINPELPIATLSDGAKLTIELGFASGRGYVSADKNKQLAGEAPLGTLFVDSIYTPVLNVSYQVDDTRVGSETDFDRLTVDVKTNGAISPDDAMAVASNIIIKHFECISALSNSSPMPEMIPDSEAKMTAVLDTAIEDLDLSVRSYNCLKRSGIDTIGNLTALSEGEMMKIRNLGQKSYDEILHKLATLGLSLRRDDE